MGNYEFKAMRLIADVFDRNDLHYTSYSKCFDGQKHETIEVHFPVDCGPEVTMRFICKEDGNDVAIRIFGLLTRIPIEKRFRILEACNALNEKSRYPKFYLDTDGDVNVECDIPSRCSDNCVGEVAYEMLRYTSYLLDDEYETFMKYLYSDTVVNQMLREMRKRWDNQFNMDEETNTDDLDEICEED